MAGTKLLWFGVTKDKIPIFVIYVSHNFPFVLWATIWLTSEIWPFVEWFCPSLYKMISVVTKPTPYLNSTNFFDHFAYYIAFLCYHMTVRVMSGSSNSHHAPVHMTKSSLMWLSASSHDSHSHSLFTFCLTHDTLLPSPVLLSTTFNLYSHSTTFSHLLLSLSPLPFATLPILQFTSLPTIPTPRHTLLSNYLCHHSHYIRHSLQTPTL